MDEDSCVFMIKSKEKIDTNCPQHNLKGYSWSHIGFKKKGEVARANASPLIGGRSSRRGYLPPQRALHWLKKRMLFVNVMCLIRELFVAIEHYFSFHQDSYSITGQVYKKRKKKIGMDELKLLVISQKPKRSGHHVYLHGAKKLFSLFLKLFYTKKKKTPLAKKQIS